MTARHSSQRHVAWKAAETAWAAPLVVAHRLQRMAAAGGNPSARDRREFSRMGWEKVAAFHESWAAMAFEAWRLQQSLWLSWFGAAWTPWRVAWPPSRGQRAAAARGMTGILGRGLAPVHRRAVANAKRLSR
jgi:hypothetical protein